MAAQGLGTSQWMLRPCPMLFADLVDRRSQPFCEHSPLICWTITDGSFSPMLGCWRHFTASYACMAGELVTRVRGSQFLLHRGIVQLLLLGDWLL